MASCRAILLGLMRVRDAWKFSSNVSNLESSVIVTFTCTDWGLVGVKVTVWAVIAP